MKLKLTTLLVSSLILSSVTLAADLELTLPEPQWMLSSVRAPLLQREARLQPNEQALANVLAPLLDTENYTQALMIIEQSLPETENPYENINPALNHLIGQIYLVLEEDDKAEAAFQSALAQLPDFVRAHQALGFLYLRQERYEDARNHVTQTITLGAANADIYGYLGYLNQETNNPWGAVSAYQQALMLDHDNPQWQQGLLYGLTESGQYQSALLLIESLLADDQNSLDLWLYRAHIALQMQDDETALTSLEVAIRLGDTNESNLQMAAQVHLQSGSIGRAVELIQASFSSGIDYTYLDQTLAWLIQEEQWNYAEDLIEQSKQDWTTLSDTDKSRMLNREGSIAEQTQSNDAAIDLLEQSIALDPGNADALIHLGNILSRENRYIQAEVLYERASAYSEFKVRAILASAQLAIDQFDYNKALDLLREAVTLDPNRYVLRENIQILENLISARQSSGLF